MPSFKPYGHLATDAFYNLLFCDDVALAEPTAKAAEHKPLVAKSFDERAIRAVAEDPNAHTRMRALAFHRLRRERKRVPAKVLLGAIVEAPMDGTPDTFAAYADGSLRYINALAEVAFVDGRIPPLADATAKVLTAAQGVMNATKPSSKERQPLPPNRARVTIIAADGVYVTEGAMEKMMRDPVTGPFIEASGLLLKSFADLMIEQTDRAMDKKEQEYLRQQQDQQKH